MMIDKKRRQVRRMRWAAGSAWVLLLTLIIVGGFSEVTGGRGVLTSSILLAARAALLIALFLTFSWYARSVSLRFESVQQALAAIQDRLAEQPTAGSQEGAC